MTFLKYSAKNDKITKSKAPACPYSAGRVFNENVAKMKSGALELIDDNGKTLDEFAAPDCFWMFQACGAKEQAEQRAIANGRPMPEPTVWRKSFQK